MGKTLPIFLLSLGTLAVAKPASAQELGSKGDAIFGAERLFGVRGEKLEAELPAPLPPIDVNETTISFGFAEQLTPYNIPRVTFDYMLINKLSLGGAIGFSTSNADVEGPGDGFRNPFLFMIAPRVGFLHMFGKVAGIWPRAGFTFHSQSLEDSYGETGFSFNVECNFPFVLTQHFGVLVGLSFDRSLFANRDPDDTVDFDVTYQSFGLQVGLFGWI